MKKILLALLIIGISPACMAQFVGASALFRPGLRIGASYQPASDTSGIAISQARLSLIVPIGGKVDLKLSELKASASQHFLSFSGSLRQIEGGPLPQAQQTPQFGIGIAGAKAGLLSGIVAYGAYAGMVTHAKGNTPFAGAGFVKIQVKGLNKQNFFGVAVIYAGQKVYPFPILGLRRKIADKTFFTALLPAQLDITRNLGKGSQLVAMASLDGFRTRFSPRTSLLPPLAQDLEARLSFARLKCGLTLNLRLSSNVRILFEGGVNAWSRVQADGKRFSWEGNPSPTPYAGLSLRMNLGNSLISSQLFGMDL